MRALGFITGHVIFKLRYNHIYQLKTTMIVEYDALQNADKAPIAGWFCWIDCFLAFSKFPDF